MLFYRHPSGTTGSSASPVLNLQSISSFDLAGGSISSRPMFRIGNLSSSNSAGCLPIVGGAPDVGNLSSFRISVSNCAAYGTRVPAQQALRLVE
ncbi:MAG TPA: hypothetical protein VNS22_00450 [Geminicoccus sp.]|nr:hypothetical protein [Geminicoccus sp.]